MKPFKQFVSENKREDIGFEKLFSRYASHVGRQKVVGDPTAVAYTVDKHQLRLQYDKLLIASTIEQTTDSASKIVDKGITRYTQRTLEAYDEFEVEAALDSYSIGDSESEEDDVDSASIVDSEREEVDVDSTSIVDSEEEVDPVSHSAVDSEEELREESPTLSPGKRRRISAQTYETQEPWFSLTVALINSISGANTVKLPPVPADMSGDHSILFRHARTLLQKYQKDGGKETVLIKDAMVSMSCVLNLFASGIEEYFDDEYLLSARQTCFREEFNRDHAVVEALRPLREILKKGIEHLSCWVRVQRGEVAQLSLAGTSGPTDRLHDQILSVVQHLCSFIMNPPFESSPPSEEDCSNQWAAIFALIKTNNISLHTGDQMLNCTKVVRKELRAEFGDISDSGRRCDLFFRSGESELANLEIKPPSRGGSIVAQQNRKNIRINRCIQLALHEVGLDAPVIAGDIVGFLGVFYVIQSYGDIFVCGPVTADVVYIPTNAAELSDFLDGESLSAMFNFIRSVDKLSGDVKCLRQSHKHRQARNAMIQQIGPRSVTPPPKPKTLQETVLLTPTKKRQA